MGRKAWDDHAKFVVCSWTHFQEALSNIQMLLRTAISTAAISYNSGKPRVDAETVGDNWRKYYDIFVSENSVTNFLLQQKMSQENDLLLVQSATISMP